MTTELVKACACVPPAKANYVSKGEIKDEICGMKTYVVGEGKVLIIYAYDRFGFTPQAFQGADIIASQGYTVFIPDFYKGDLLSNDIFRPFPPTDPAKKATLAAYFSTGPGSPAAAAENIEKIISYAKENGYEKVGAVGFCWGAKPVFLSPSLAFKSAIHPSLLTADDGEGITVPTAVWATKDEDGTIMGAIRKTLEEKPFGKDCLVHIYTDCSHGFAAARANFEDSGDRERFDKGFANLLAWFKTVI